MGRIHATSTKVISFAFLFLSAAIQGFAADGELDPTFGSGGIVQTALGQNSEQVVDISIQGDGKSLALGRSEIAPQNTWRSVVVRYNVDGTIDTSFGTDGKVFIPNVFPKEVMWLADGKIIVAGAVGTSFSDSRVYIARLNAGGTFDTTFNGTGTVIFDNVGFTATGVEVQADGKLIATANFRIIRLLSDGTLDATFGNGGTVLTAYGSSNLKIQSDGKFVGASSALQGNLSVFSAYRYNTDGSPDTTFGVNGVVYIRFTETGTDPFNSATAMALQPGGKIVVAGVTGTANPFYARSIAVVRLHGDGIVDTTFGTAGKVIVSYFNAELSANDIVIQGDNKVVIAARINFVPKVSHFAFLRLKANGSLDPTFNENGWFSYVQPTFGGWGSGNAVAIQADGKIVGGGYIKDPNQSPVRFTLARFTNPSCPANCLAPRQAMMDFDGDGKTDLSVFRTGTWFINPSGNPNSFYSVQWGVATDTLTPADFDGDGKTDIAVWRENVGGTFGYFYILESSTGTYRIAQFGTAGDDPRVVGDWDRDGKADLAVYREGAAAGAPSIFYYRPSSQPATDYVPVYWGSAGDEPLRGDFDGDGRVDAAIFRPSDNVWYILQSSNSQVRYVYSGIATDKRVSGDFDGDGTTDIAKYSDGLWAVLLSSNNQGRYEYWGLGTDVPVPGDYDGDGRTDFAVWRDGDYYILTSSGSNPIYQHFGQAGDIPAASFR